MRATMAFSKSPLSSLFSSLMRSCRERGREGGREASVVGGTCVCDVAVWMKSWASCQADKQETNR